MERENECLSWRNTTFHCKIRKKKIIFKQIKEKSYGSETKENLISKREGRLPR